MNGYIKLIDLFYNHFLYYHLQISKIINLCALVDLNICIMVFKLIQKIDYLIL